MLSGLAAAIDEYEHAPHDGATVRRRRGARISIGQVAHHARRLSRDERLGAMSAPPELPEIVTRAFDVSRRAGYVSFCRNETGRLLATLAATRDGTMAEFGTGCGVGTAWLRSGVRGGDTPDPHRRARPDAGRGGVGDLPRRRAGGGAGRRLVDAAGPRPVLAALPRLGEAVRLTARQGRRADGRGRDRRPRRLHARATRGRRSSTVASTPCARSGSATSGSPRPRCSSPPTRRP